MGSPTIAVWDAASPSDHRRWIGLWESWPRREVFAHPNYVTLFADGDARAYCAALGTDDGGILYPFILRTLDREPYWTAELPPATDVTSPYGYGGAFAWGTGTGALAAGFWAEVDAWLRERQVVSEFVRFSLFGEDLLEYPGEIREASTNVVRTLDPRDDLWTEFEHKVRKNVKKAQRSGVEVELDPVGERLDDFLALYAHTMTRRAASASYRFPKAFFEAIRDGLGGQFMFVHALHGGVMASSELVLVSAERVYSFLGGTRGDAFDVRPNDLLKVEIMRWARAAGKTSFVLGGGYEPDDGIFRYKRSFAPRGLVPFFVGHRVLDDRAYRALVDRRRAWSAATGQAWSPRAGYFPAYRS